MERIPADNWQAYTGHVDRYVYASEHIVPGEEVNDIACGVGYGSVLLSKGPYRGYDREGIPDQRFSGPFYTADLDDPLWVPEPADVTVCFETLEHVKNPAYLAQVIAETSRRAIIVSVPVVPTKHMNPHHLHDFIRDEIPPLFTGFSDVEDWAQDDELSHVWVLVKDHYA